MVMATSQGFLFPCHVTCPLSLSPQQISQLVCLQDKHPKTFICRNSENHWPEPTRKEATPALLLEDADDPSVLSS